MALIIRIAGYKDLLEADSLGRTWAGYFPRMTEQEAYEAGRGVWRLGPRADHERFALIVGGDVVRSVIEIDEFVDDPVDEARRSFVGTVLAEGHPMRETYLEKADPSGSRSRNPIAYVELPEEHQFRVRYCACGCGTETKGEFAPGHDLRAIQQRIGEHFDGSTKRFLDWFDQHPPIPA